MSETGDAMRAIHARRAVEKRLRRHFGISCPVCKKQRPRGCPTKLMPHEKCPVDHYIDPRPLLSMRQYLEILDG